MANKKKPTRNWDAFCKWLLEDMELGDVKIPIEWTIIRQAPKGGMVDPLIGEEIVRIDLFPDKPYKVSVGIPNKYKLITHEMSYYIGYRLMFIIKDAIESNSPRCFIPYTQF